MGDPMMSATFQQHQQYPNNIQTSMDFPHNFLEPSISSTVPIAQTKTNTFFSPNAVYSSNNSSLSSSRQRLACDDSGIISNGSLANDQDNSSMQFLSSALATTVNDCIGSPNQMNFGTNDLLDDFEPVARDRCNTWPMRHPNTEFQSNNSPIIHERIPEEESIYSRNGSQISVHLAQDPFMNSQTQLNTQLNTQMNNQNQMNNVSYQQMPVNDNQEQELNYDSPHTYSDGNSHDSGDEDEFQGTVQKRSQTRRNAWGNMSYADLITQAILSSPDQRLTLSEVYQFMVENVPYFSDKGDSNSSAGWKNSIRHNLSLHSRFMRIQNEGAGKSSWWVINPDAKTGRNPRRRATMDASTKNAIDKKRRGARKRVEMQGSVNSLASTNRKASQPDFYNNHAKEEEIDSDYDSSFRSRTFSNVSCHGRNQISPNFTPNDDFEYPPWASNNLQSGQVNSPNFVNQSNNTINELMDRTDQICLATDDEYSQLGGCALSQPQQLNVYGVQQQVSPNFQQIKHEEMKPQFQQTSYQELKAVRGIDQQMQNSLLNQFQKQPQQFVSNQQAQTRNGNYPFGCNGVANQQRWQGNNNQNSFQQQSNYQQKPQMTQQLISPNLISQPQMVQQFSNQMLPQSTLPKDLENLNTFVTQDCNVQGIDEIIRQELSTSNNLNFDF